MRKAIALDPKDGRSRSQAGALLLRVGQEKEGLVLLEEALRLDPKDTLAAFNAGQAYQNQHQWNLARQRFEAVVAANPDDWHAFAKLVQVSQALGNTPERDKRRQQVLALYRAGKTDARLDTFCREQFEVGANRVMVLEAFEMKGDRPRRYAFEVVGGRPGAEKMLRTLSLGSYASTEAAARSHGELGPGDHLFHLDGYYPDNSHETFAFFKNEPSYEDTRALVVQVLEGKLKPVSSTTFRR